MTSKAQRTRPTFRSVPRLSLRDEAATQLRAHIASGSLTAGELYSIGAIAAELGVSATPVREAVLELANEDIVEIVHNRGFRVHVLTDVDLDHILELRLALEVPAMGRLAELKPAPDLLSFRPIAHTLVKNAKDGDFVEFVALDREFHLGLTALLGNPRYVRLVDLLRRQARLPGLRDLRGAEKFLRSAEEHDELLDLIEAGDRANAEALMKRHLGHTRGLWAGRAESD